MQAKTKSNSVVTSAFDAAIGLLAITVVGVKDGVIKFDARSVVGASAYDSLNDIGKRAIGHAFTQRLSDRAAMPRDRTTGLSATPYEKYMAIKLLADHLMAGGAWELTSDLPPVNRPFLYQSVAAVRGVPAEKVEALYRDKPDEVVRTLLTIPAIAGKYTELCKTGTATNDKADAMLKELDALIAPTQEQPKPEEPKQQANGSKRK